MIPNWINAVFYAILKMAWQYPRTVQSESSRKHLPCRSGSGEHGSVETPINNSKGCGGVMRVAPIGLYFNDRKKDIRDICRFGAETAALTHGHPHGWMPAAALAQIEMTYGKRP